MALSQVTLKNEFLKMFDQNNPQFIGFPATMVDTALNWANAYTTYTLGGEDVSGEGLISGNTPLFIASLIAGLPPIGIPLTASLAFETAFTSYWMGALFTVNPIIVPIPTVTCPNLGGNGFFSTKTISAVTAVAPGILQSLLLVEFSILSGDVNLKADALATAFHTATIQAVQVTISGLDTTVPTPLPITNVCGVF